MSKNGPEKMSKKKLMQVLAILRPWELEVLDVEAAIKVLVDDLQIEDTATNYRACLRLYPLVSLSFAVSHQEGDIYC